jgi:hypothetical protein
METRPMAEASPQFPCHDAGPGVRGRSLPPQPPRWHGPWPLADSRGVEAHQPGIEMGSGSRRFPAALWRSGEHER